MTRPASKLRRPSYRTGAKLVPMRSSAGSRDFILEQLSGVRALMPKAMFGGMGLYSAGAFFGLVARDRLYLKVNDSNRARFEQAGSVPFKPYADRPMTMSYWEVPPPVLEDAEELARWARAAIAVALAAPAKPSRRATGSPPKAAARQTSSKAAGAFRKPVPSRRRSAPAPGRKRGV